MRAFQTVLLPLALTTLVLLPACGGGGGGGEDDAAVPAPGAWIAADPGPGFDYARGMAAGPDDTAYVSGWFPGTQDWDVGEPTATTRTAIAQNDGYVARYDTAGKLLWLQQILGTDFVDPTEVVTLSDGSCVVAGETDGTTIFAALEPEQTTLNTGPVLFLARYLPDGTLDWVRIIEGSLEARGSTLYPDGSFAICGIIFGTAVFGPGEGAQTTLTCTSGFSDYVARYTPDGDLVFAISPSDCSGNSIAGGVAALPDGTTVVAGTFAGTVTFGDGTAGEETFSSTGFDDGYVARFSATGTQLWARHLAGAGRELPYGAATLPNGTVAIIGSSTETALTLSEGETDEQTLTASGGFTFVCRYSATGSPVWATQIDHGAGAFLNIAGIVAYPDNAIGIAAVGPETVTVDPNGPDREVLPAFDGMDLLLVRYDAAGRVIAARRDSGLGTMARAEGVAGWPDGSLGFAGGYQRQFTVDQGGPNETTYPDDDATDTIVLRYNPDLSHDGE
ncbi:MAG: hypothetical protein QNJ98_09570 [Planctomycetota bacterium]|nr:hypothetical protein [Planctomycetota bacterium]